MFLIALGRRLQVFMLLLMSVQFVNAQDQLPALEMDRRLYVDYATTFYEGFARLTQNGKSWYIEKNGNLAFDSILVTWTQKDESDAAAEEELNLVVRKGMYGVVSRKGKWILPAEYNMIDVEWKDLWRVWQKGKKSFSDKNGKLLLPFLFEEPGYLDGDHFDVKQGAKWGIYSAKKGKVTIPFEYEKIDFCGGCGQPSGYFFAQKNGKWGVVTFDNKALTPFKYDHSHSMMRSDEWVTCFSLEDESVVLNLFSGKEYAGPAYSDGSVLDNGLLSVRQKGRKGVVSTTGKVVLDFKYDDVLEPGGYGGPQPGFLITELKGKYGLADTTGKILLEPVYEELPVICFDSLVLLVNNGMWKVCDLTGRPVLPGSYSEISVFRIAGVLRTKKDGLYGWYNPVTGIEVKSLYEEAAESYEELPYLQIEQGGWKGIADSNGKVIVPAQYNECDMSRYKGFVYVKKGEKRGIYDMNGKLLVPVKYDFIFKEESGFHAKQYMDDGNIREAVYDVNGKETPYVMENTTGENEVVASPVDNRKKSIVNAAYLEIFTEKNGRGFLVKSEKGFGIVNIKGKEVIPPVYDDIALNEYASYLSEDVAFTWPLLCLKDGKWRYINEEGKELPIWADQMTAY